MQIKLVILFIIVFVTGCSHQSNMYQHSYNKNYTLGETKTAYIGDPIVKVRDFYVPVDSDNGPKCFSMVPSKDFILSGSYKKKLLFNYDIAINANKQGTYISNGSVEYDGQNYKIIDISDSKGTIYGLLIDSNGIINKNVIYNDDHDHFMISKNAILNPQEVKMTNGNVVYCDTKDDEHKSLIGYINYELLYGGINNVSLTLTYREFTRDDLARSSFFQNVIYETNVKLLRYKDLKIEVLDANNEKLVYKVIEDGLNESAFSENNAPIEYRNILSEEELKRNMRK